MNLPGHERSRPAPPLGARRASRTRAIRAICVVLALTPARAHASGFEDGLAEVVSWLVIFVVPAVLLVVFWLVHILPEKIAEKRHHPQAKAIQVLCLLSLVFGGLLWPLAWLWAYTKPVFYKMAYGTDIAKHEEIENPAAAKGGHV